MTNVPPSGPPTVPQGPPSVPQGPPPPPLSPEPAPPPTQVIPVATPAPPPPPAAPAPQAPAASPPPSAAAAWSPTHVVPAEGAWAWDRPDPSLQPVAPLDPGVPVRVDRREGGWAAITCSNGWQAWVDDRVLEEVRSPPPPPAAPSTAPPGPPTGTGGRPRWLPFAALAVVVAVVAGVFLVGGGSDKESTSSSGGSDKESTSSSTSSALSKAEFIKQGDAVCAGLTKSTDAIAEPTSEDEVSDYLTALIPPAKKARADFAALTPPADGQDIRRALLGSLDALLAAVDKAVVAADDGDFEKMGTLLDDASAVSAEVEADADAYGFKDCGTES